MTGANCPACDSSSAVRLMHVHSAVAQRDFSVLRCSSCEVCFLDPLPSYQELETWYHQLPEPEGFTLPQLVAPGTELGGESFTAARLAGAVSWACQRAKFAAQLGWVERWAKPTSATSLLDVGCGSGAFLEAARDRFGLDAMGLEIAPAALQQARERGFEVLDAPLSQRRPQQRFDLITAWSYFEHEREPRRTLQAMRDCLEPGGSLILEVPDISAPLARRLGPDWPALEVPFHVLHYSERPLKQLLTNQGFRLKSLLSTATPAWTQANSELLLGLFLRHGQTPALRRLLQAERRWAPLRAGLLGLSFALGQGERALGLSSRLLLHAVAA